MALADNAVFAHFGDALAEDHPGGATQSNPSGHSNPTASGGVLTFGGSNGLIHTYGSNIWAPGTGDFSIAIRATIGTLSSSSDVMIHLGTSAGFSNELLLRVDSAANRTLCLSESYTTSLELVTSNNFVTAGSPFILVAVRASDVWTLYDGSGSDVTGSNNFGSGYSITAASDITLGSEYDGSGGMDGDIDWVVTWDRALTSTELANNMNETDLKAAITGGGGATGRGRLVGGKLVGGNLVGVH